MGFTGGPIDAADARADVAAANDASSEVGAGSDGSPDGGCCACVDDPTTAATFGNWMALGAASGQADFFELTPEAAHTSSAVLWKTPLPSANFDVSFDISITHTGTPADGLAFVVLTVASRRVTAGTPSRSTSRRTRWW